MKNRVFVERLAFCLLGVLVGILGLVLVSPLPDHYFASGVQAERDRDRDLYLKKPDDQKDGVWFYSNLIKTPYIIANNEVRRKVRGPILFNSHVVYSRYFAKQYGYPDAYIAEGLPDYVDFISWDMKYAGGYFNSCNITMLLDKGGPIQLYDKDVFHPFSGGSLNMMRAPQPDRLKDFSEKPYQFEYRTQHNDYFASKSLRNSVHGAFALVGLQDPDKENGAGASVTLTVEQVRHRLFKEWNLVEVDAGCSALVKQIVEQPYLFIVMRPKGAAAFSWAGANSMDHMLNLRLPDLLVKAVRADFDKIDFQIDEKSKWLN